MKIEVHLQGGLRKIIDITPGATVGATVGVNLRNPDGTMWVPPSTDGGSQLSITSWELILNIPANVTALANTATTGLYTITGPGTSTTRALTDVAGETTVANGDGVSGNPTVGLADVTPTAGGTLQKYGFDSKGRRVQEEAATTDNLPEGATNLYFTAARVLATVLSGLSLATGTAITAADSVLVAFGKLQKQITDLAAALSGYVPTSRTINTTAPLTGGGDLTANRTLAISAATTGAAGSMSAADKTKLNGIATGATVGADWSVNLANIPANIVSWSSIAPASKADASALANYLPLAGGTMTGNIVVGVDDYRLSGNTTAGSDTRRITLVPAGTMSATRNAYLLLCGANHATTPNLAQIVAGTGSDMVLTAGGSAVRPGNDNAVTSGNGSFRWSVVYAATGTINTSDAREKTPVEPLSPNELAAAQELAREIGTYRWLSAIEAKGDDARLHVGLTVQRVIEIMDSHHLNPFAYGFICFDQWEARPELWDDVPEELDEAGNVLVAAHRVKLQDAVDAGSRYSFRMDELLMFIACGQEERIRRLEALLNP